MAQKIDELFYEISFELSEADMKRAQQRAREFNQTVTQGQKDLERFGSVGGAALRQVTDELTLSERDLPAVTTIVNKFIENLETEFRRGIASARLELEAGIIDEDEFRETARVSAQVFNDEISQIERALEAEGVLGPQAQRRLIGQFKDTGEQAVDEFVREVASDAEQAEQVMRETGRKGGRQFGQEVEKGAESGLSRIEQFIRGAFAVGILAGLGAAVQRVVRLFADMARKVRDALQLAGEIEGVEIAFRQLTEGAGLDAVLLLEELRQGARATVSDLELMRRANEALQTGLRGTEERFGEMVDVSRRLARSLGRDAGDAFQRFVQATVRGRRRILDDIGVMVDFGRAHQEFADEVGKSVDQLSEQEKVQARLNEAVRAGRVALTRLGEDAPTTGTRLSQVATALQNIRDRAVVALAESPRVESFLRNLATLATDATGRLDDLELQIGALIDTVVGFTLDDLPDDSVLRALLFANLRTAEALKFTVELVGGGLVDEDTRGALQETFEERLRERRQRAALEEIRREDDLTKLRQRRSELEERLLEQRQQFVRLTQDEAAAEREVEAAFRDVLTTTEEIEAVRERIADQKIFDPAIFFGTGDEDPLPGLKEEEIQRRVDAVSDLITQMETLQSVGLGALQFEQLTEEQQELVGQLIQTRSEIEQLEAVMETGRGSQAMAERLRFLRGEAAGLEEEIGETVDLFDDLDETIAKIAEGFGAFEERDFGEESFGGRAATEKLASRVSRVQAELERFAEAEGDPINQSVELKRLLDDLQLEFAQLSGPIQRAILRIIGYEQAVKAGIIEPTEEADEAVSELSDTFGEIADGARGVLQLADAIGVLDDDLRRTLQGAIELADGIKAIQKAQALGEGIGIGSIAQVAGGAIGLASGVIGGLFGPDPEQQRIREEAERLADTMAELTASIDRLRSVFDELPGNLIADLREVFRVVDEEGILSFRRTFEGLGLTADDLRAVERATGAEFDALIEILEGGSASFAEARDEIDALRVAIDGLDLERLFETFGGQMELFRRELDLFDIEDPIRQLRRMREIFLEFADLPAELEAAIRGADLETPEGRARLESLLQRLFRQVTSGQLSTGQLGLSEFLDALGDLKTTLEDVVTEADDGGPGAESSQIFRGVTETTAQRLEGLGSTRNLILHNIDRNVAAIAADMGVGTGPAGGFLEPGGFPTGGGGGGGGVDAEMIPGGPILLPTTVLEPPPVPPTTQQILLDIAVDADIDLRGVDSPEEVAEIVSRLLGDRVTEDVNERLGRRLQQVRRGEHGVGMERRV